MEIFSNNLNVDFVDFNDYNIKKGGTCEYIF